MSPVLHPAVMVTDWPYVAGFGLIVKDEGEEEEEVIAPKVVEGIMPFGG